MSEVQSSFQLSPGDSAPEFSLPDADGKMVARAEVAGVGGLLVMFACNHCPFVIHLADAVGEFAREIAAQSVTTVAINSNDLEKYPQDGPEPMKAFATERGWDFPYLLDESQQVAHAYGAVCTPDFFLFNSSGKLFYAGQFDDSRPRSGLAPRRGFARSGAADAGRRAAAGPPLPEQRVQYQVEAGQ